MVGTINWKEEKRLDVFCFREALMAGQWPGTTELKCKIVLGVEGSLLSVQIAMVILEKQPKHI